jgi:acyl-CoA dehydrogenase
MQQLIITVIAMMGVMAPIAAGKLLRMLMTPRLLKLFQHQFLTTANTQAVILEEGASRADPHQFEGNPDWHKLLAYASSGRSFCIAFACRLFPKNAAAM